MSHFYHESIRKYIVVFGTLFNDLTIKRDNCDEIKVPVSYASKEKFIAKLYQDNNDSTPANETILPRMGFILTGLNYDPTRMVNPSGSSLIPTGDDTYTQVFTPIPYNFEFELGIYVRNHDDGLQLLEQILPNFRPYFNISLNETTLSGVQARDFPVTLRGVNLADQYEGSMMTGDRRHIEWSLNFSAAGYIYPDYTQNVGVIKQTIVNLHGQEVIMTDENKFYSQLKSTVDPITATENDEFTIIDEYITP